jgi:HD-like signal output (HDOD) protein
LPLADVHDCFIAGLLHDFGKVVVAQFMPQEFRKALEMSLWQGIALHQAIVEVIGVDHAAIGAMLAEKWRFAPGLVDTIRHQHTPEQCDTDMMACVVAADQISKRLGVDFCGSPVLRELPDTVVARLGGKIEELQASLGNISPLMQETTLFANL